MHCLSETEEKLGFVIGRPVWVWFLSSIIIPPANVRRHASASNKTLALLLHPDLLRALQITRLQSTPNENTFDHLIRLVTFKFGVYLQLSNYYLISYKYYLMLVLVPVF